MQIVEECHICIPTYLATHGDPMVSCCMLAPETGSHLPAVVARRPQSRPGLREALPRYPCSKGVCSSAGRLMMKHFPSSRVPTFVRRLILLLTPFSTFSLPITWALGYCVPFSIVAWHSPMFCRPRMSSLTPAKVMPRRQVSDTVVYS